MTNQIYKIGIYSSNIGFIEQLSQRITIGIEDWNNFEFHILRDNDTSLQEVVSFDIIIYDYAYILDSYFSEVSSSLHCWLMLLDTNYIHYKVLDFEPTDYLFANADIVENLNKIKSVIEIISVVQGKHNLPSARTVFVKDISNQQTEIDQDSIIYLESFGDYTKLIYHHSGTSVDKKITLPINLKNSLMKFDIPFLFRIHRTYAISLKWIASGNDVIIDEIKLKNGLFLPLARRRRADFKTAYQSIQNGDI